MSSLSTFSARHMELLAAVVKNLKTTDVDWETVATDANYKTSKYARDEYNKIWKKLQVAATANNDGETGDATESGTPAAAATTTPKGKKHKAATEKTPVKAKKPKKSEAVVEEAEDEETQVKPEPKDYGGESEEAQNDDTFV